MFRIRLQDECQLLPFSMPTETNRPVVKFFENLPIYIVRGNICIGTNHASLDVLTPNSAI